MFKTLKRLMSMVKKRGRYITGLLLISIVSASTNVTAAFALKFFVRAAQTKDIQILYTSIAFMAGGLFLFLVLMPLGYWLYETSVVGGTANMRSQVFKSLLRLKTRWLDGRHSGDLTSRATNDVQEAEKAYSQNLVQMVELLMEGIASAVVMFIVDWKLALPLVFLGLVSVWLNRMLVKPMHKAAEDVQKALGATTERISDIANGNQIIRMFDSRETIEAKFLEQNQDAVEKGLTRTKYAARVNAFNTLNGYFSFLVLALVGGWLVLKGWYQFDTIMLFTQLQNGVRNLFVAMGSYITALQTSLAGGKRVLEILDAPKEPERLELPAAASPSSAAVSLEAVTFAYNGGEPALENISLAVQPGETVALVGPSGGGKSTLFKLLLGYYPPEAGAISILGRGLNQYSLQELREHIAYVPQTSYLFSGTIAENIGFGNPGASREEIEAAARAAYAHDFITQLPQGYETLVGERGSHLSGGQRQRIAIARAILRNAPLLLLDEATSSLDTESEEQVQLALSRLMQGRTTLVIAHRLATVQNAGRILVIAHGKLAEEGSHQELMEAKGIYRNLHDMQFEEDLQSAG
jgi:ABC-type multidrug transport system fused ATPase/permease subunit